MELMKLSGRKCMRLSICVSMNMDVAWCTQAGVCIPFFRVPTPMVS